MSGPSTLHVALQMGEAAAPYNQHCLPLHAQRQIGICTYWPPDVVPAPGIAAFHGGGTFPGFLRAVGAALESRAWDVVHVHNPHLGALFSVGRALLGRRRFPPLVITVRSSYDVARVKHRLMYLPTFATFDAVVCCGHASLESFPRLYRRLGGGRLSAIPNGIDLGRVDRAQGSPPVAFTAVAVARLVDVKRLDVTIQAFAAGAGPESRLVLVGAGPLRTALAAEAEAKGVATRVEFTGLLDRDAALAQMKSADVFVSTSAGEGLPVAVLEAMGCRLPVVLSDIPPHREIARGSDFIPLVRPGDAAGFAAELARFRAMPAGDRRQLGERCRRIVEQRYSMWRMLTDYDREYERVAHRARAPQLAH